jgi:predicted Zn-dependent protease
MKTVKSSARSNPIAALFAEARAAEGRACYAFAAERFHHILAEDSSKVAAKYRAARNLLEIGRISEAETLLTSLRGTPGSKVWLVELAMGELRMAQFKPEVAEQHFRRALRFRPTLTSPAVYLADCLAKQEKLDEAKQVLIRASKTEGDLDEVFLNLGLIMRTKGDYQAAKSFLVKALRLSPRYAAAKAVLADVELCLRLQHRFARLHSPREGKVAEARINQSKVGTKQRP